jgi:hypothetical protein
MVRFFKVRSSLKEIKRKGINCGWCKGFFLLTKFGEKIAKETKDSLEKGIGLDQKGKLSQGRSIDDRLINYLKESPQFKAFLKNPVEFSISEPEFRSLLRCTLETPPRVVKQNIEYYKNLANLYNEKQLLEFLLFCEKKFIKK